MIRELTPTDPRQTSLQFDLLTAAIKIGDAGLIAVAAFHVLTIVSLHRIPVDAEEMAWLFGLLDRGPRCERLALNAAGPVWPLCEAFAYESTPQQTTRREAAPAAAKSVFIYDAYADAAAAGPSYVAAGDTLVVRVRVRNPFPVRLRVALELKVGKRTSGGGAQGSAAAGGDLASPTAAGDRSVDLVPEETRLELEAEGARECLLFAHLIRGEDVPLLVSGAHVTVHGIRFFAPWVGAAPEIFVIPPMPKLVAAFDGPCDLFEGEETSACRLRIQNLTSTPVRCSLPAPHAFPD